MKKMVLLWLIGLLSIPMFAQTTGSITYPEYPGGFDALRTYMVTHFHEVYHVSLTEHPDTWYVEFTIDPKGNVASVKILTNQIPDAMKAAIEETLIHMPAWKPGTDQNGKPSTFKFVVNF
jgi:hypothetical protein